MDKTVITIAREFGSGGREIGLKLSNRLGIPFYDKEILKKVAEGEGMHEDFVARNEERRPQISPPIFGRSMISTFYPPSFSDTIFINQVKIIKDLAAQGSCVIVGRCADYILADFPSVVRIMIHAGMPYKISRKHQVAPEKAGYTDEEMEKYIRETDRERKKYYEHYTGLRRGAAENFELCIKTDSVGVDGAVETILAYLEYRKKIIAPFAEM